MGTIIVTFSIQALLISLFQKGSSFKGQNLFQRGVISSFSTEEIQRRKWYHIYFPGT